MSNKHLSFTAKKEVWKFLKKKALEEEVDRGKVEFAELPKEVTELTKDLEGGMYGSDQTIQEKTLACLRYLKSRGEASHKDFKNDVYPKFEKNHTEENFWKMASEGLKQIERKRMFSEKENLLETPKDRSYRRYTWKL